VKSNDRADHHRRVPPAGAVFPKKSYLNDGTTIRSWLLTHDHKRIAILYLVSVLIGLFLGGVFAMVIRLELLTPGRPSSRR
jgi:cytochrome c oxidase subunit 1